MSKIIAVTHDDRFHADDVFSAAVLQLIYREDLEIIRSRDEEIIKKANIVFDVGGIYNSEKDKFDHHQKESAGKRDNEVPYASFGLVWKKWGEKLCGSKDVAESVDKTLVQSVDAGDNGYSIANYLYDDLREYTLDRMCYAFGSTWEEEENYDTAFFEVVEIAKKILQREITIAKHKNEAIPIVKESYESSEDKRLLILEEYVPFSSFVEDKEEILFVVSPNKNKTLWRINTIQEVGFKNKKDFPKEWGGLKDENLEKVTGVEGSVFCHKNLFLTVAKNRESAIKLAQLAINYDK